MNTRSTITAVFIASIAGVGVAYLYRPAAVALEQPSSESESSGFATTTAAAQPSSNPLAAPSMRDAPINQNDVSRVSHKYRFLLDDIPPRLRERALALLIEREDLVKAKDRGHASVRIPSQARLLKIENQLRALLGHAAFTQFEMYKDSDREQQALGPDAGNSSNVAPTNLPQERAVLDAKLRHKQQYETILINSGIEQAGLPLAQRQYAYEVVGRALNEYKDGYLRDVRPYLPNEEQYTLLSNYEETEFRRELDRLQELLNAR
jgi:hypothetical protein